MTPKNEKKLTADIMAAAVIPDDHPKALVQLSMGRISGKEDLFTDITMWDWMDLQNPKRAVSMNKYMCSNCYAPVPEVMCPKCYTVFDDPGDRHEGLAIRGDRAFVADIILKVLEGVDYDADLLVIYIPEPVDTGRDIMKIGRKAVEELLENTEYRLYTRDNLAKDTGAGATIAQCVRMFLEP